MGDQWLYDQALWDAMGDSVVGARYVSVHSPDLPSEASKRFVAAFEKKFGAEPDVNVALGYENIQTILMTIDKLNGKVNDGKVFIKTLAGLDYQSPRGRMHFNSDNNAQLDKVYLVEVVRGADGKLHRKLVDTFPGGKDLPGCKMKAS
jgi:branched-chain amino acid transport system substrate-binding protein